jgi:large repetitive protein
VTGTLVMNVEIAGLEINAAFNDGIALTDATSVSVSSVSVLGSLNNGISGTNVNGFTLDGSTIDGNGNAAVESGIAFTDLTGTASISSTTIANSVADNVRIVNATGVLDRVTFSNVTFGSNNLTAGNDSLFLQATGAATFKATIENSTFTGARGDLFQFSVRDSAVADLVFSGNALSNNHANIASGGGGVVIGGGSAGFNATLTYSITGNTFRDAVGTALAIGKGAAGTGNFSGSISNNVIGVAAVANSGSAQGSGIAVDIVGGGSHTTTITNNEIYQFTNYGILLSAGSNVSGGGQGNLVAVVQGNVIASPSANSAASFFPTSGIRLNSGTATGDNAKVCLTAGGSGALENSVTGSGTNGGADIRLFQRFLTTVGLPGYSGANNDNTAVVSFVKGNNGGTPTVVASNSVSSGGGGYIGTCP